MTAFDPYYHWLGIRDAERPPNHYRLLGLEPLEDDPQVISVAADRQMAHLRTFQNGPHAAASQQLLNEVALARVCLLDAERKRVYDQQLLVKRTTDRLAAAEARAAAEQEAAEVRPRIQVASPRGATRSVTGASPASPVTLGRPGRGNRDRVPRKLVVPVIVAAILFCVLGWWYRYRVDRPASEPLQARRTPASASGSSTDSDAGVETTEAREERSETDSPERPERSEADSPERSEADNAGRSEADNAGRSEAGASGESSGAGEDVKGGDSPVAANPAAGATDAAAAKPSTASSTGPLVSPREAGGSGTGGAADWNAADLAVVERPMAIRATDEASTLASRLTRRELDAVRATLNSWLKPGAVPPPSTRRDDLQLVFDLLDEFWTGVESGAQSVQPGTALMFGAWEVTVREKTSAGLVLEMKTGKRHTFDVRRAAIHRDLAIGLLEHHYRHSRPTAWRLAGLFLLLDRQGDTKRAKDYLGRAEAEGFSTGFILDAVRRLGGMAAGAAGVRGDRPGLAGNGPRVAFRALN